MTLFSRFCCYLICSSVISHSFTLFDSVNTSPTYLPTNHHSYITLASKFTVTYIQHHICFVVTSCHTYLHYLKCISCYLLYGTRNILSTFLGVPLGVCFSPFCVSVLSRWLSCVICLHWLDCIHTFVSTCTWVTSWPPWVSVGGARWAVRMFTPGKGPKG